MKGKVVKIDPLVCVCVCVCVCVFFDLIVWQIIVQYLFFRDNYLLKKTHFPFNLKL